MATTRQRDSQLVRNRTNPRAQRGQAQPVVGTTMGASGLPLLRTSERGAFKRCHWKWWLEFHENVKPTIDIPPLRFGSLIHESLAAYYIPGVKRGPKPHKTFDLLYARDLVDVSGTVKSYSVHEIDARWADHRDLGMDMLERYFDKYGSDDEWKVLVTEFPFQTIVTKPGTAIPWFWYVGILDGVWLNLSTGKKLIVDHKTAASIQLDYLRMDPQSTAYWTFGVDGLIRHGLLAPDGSEHIDGVLFNFLRKALHDDRPQDSGGMYRNNPVKDDYFSALVTKRGFNPKWKIAEMKEFADKHKVVVLGEISKRQPSPYHARVPVYRAWHEREEAKLSVLAEFSDIENVRKNAGERGTPVAYKNPSQFTCPGCWALDICELHEIGQDWVELKEMTTKAWDPYAAHEIREGR